MLQVWIALQFYLCLNVLWFISIWRFKNIRKIKSSIIQKSASIWKSKITVHNLRSTIYIFMIKESGLQQNIISRQIYDTILVKCQKWFFNWKCENYDITCTLENDKTLNIGKQIFCNTVILLCLRFNENFLWICLLRILTVVYRLVIGQVLVLT